MTSRHRLRRYRRALDFAPWTALAAGILLSIGGFLLAQHAARLAEQERTGADFLRNATDQVEVLKREFEHGIHTLHALRALFAASDTVTEDEFIAFTGIIQNRHPGLHAQFWVPRVRDEAGEHYPVRFVEVHDARATREAHRLDFADKPGLLGKMLAARDSGQLVLYDCPLLCLPDDPRRMLMMILPVYASQEPPGTVEARRAQLQGFIVQGLLLEPFMDEAMQGMERRGMSFWISLVRDGEPPRPLHFHPATLNQRPATGRAAPPQPASGPRLHETIDLGAQQLAILAAPAPGFYIRPTPSWPWLVLLGGLAIALLTALFLASTRRHLAELTRVSRALNVISTSNRTLLRADDEAELLQKVCNNAVAHGYRLAWVGFAEHDEARSVRVVAKAGFDEGYTDTLDAGWGDDARGQGPAGTAIRSGQPVIVGDVRDAPGFALWRERALMRDYRSVIGLPLSQDGRPFGVLCIYAREVGAFTPDEVRILQELADDLAYGILTLRLRREHEASEARLAHLAFHDPLTDLPNRASFTEEVGRALDHARRHDGSLAVLFIDLDDFKLINDTQGHGIGDALLRLVASRLRAVLRDEDLIARQGGDEFLVLVTGSDRGREASPSRRRGPGARQDPGEAIVHQATAVAEKLLEALRQPFRLGEMDFYLRASIGISVFPDHADSVDTMLQFADAAMYRAKALGTGGYRFYTADLSERQHQRLKLERRLHKALERKEFLLHYQPLVDLSSGRMIGVEALIRWQDPLDGLIAPADFLAVAEASGMINPVGEWVLGEACRQLADWRRRGIGLKMAINLSVRQFWHVDMTALVERVAAEAGIPFDALELEVTESAMMLEEGALEQQVRALAKAGFSISLDDFGTGYSSLSRLSELPIHVLKIDKSFIDGLLVDPQRWAIVDTVVRFARHLGIQCLAEGIETAEQWAELRRLGCHAGQGYLFCRPCPAVEVEAAYAAPPWKAPPWSHPPASSQPPEIVS